MLKSFEATVVFYFVFVGERFSNPKTPYSGEPCAWTWEELERRDVKPPFKPHLVSSVNLLKNMLDTEAKGSTGFRILKTLI